jgi:hypothetical protein
MVVLSQLAATRLRVEYLENPLTIDVAQPRFSWALQHSQRAQAQTAYQIIVSLSANSTVVWDSGKVNSNNSLNIPYNGKALRDDSDYSWIVIWWDSTGSKAPPSTGCLSKPLNFTYYQKYDAYLFKNSSYIPLLFILMCCLSMTAIQSFWNGAILACGMEGSSVACR